MWRRLSIVMAMFVGSLVGAVLALKSDRVAENLRQRVEVLAQEHLGVELHVTRLGLELLPPRIHVVGVELIEPGQREPSMQLARGSVSIHPWPSAAGALVIDHLYLEGLVAKWPLLQDKFRNTAGSGEGLPLDVHELLVQGANVTVALPDGALSVVGVDISMTAHGRNGRKLHAAVARGRLEQKHRHISFSGQLAASLFGSLDRPERLSIASSEVTVQGVEIETHGDVLLKGPPSAQVSFSAQGPLSRLREAWPEVGDVGGTLRAAGTLAGTLDDPKLHATFAASELRYGGRALGAFEILVQGDRSSINIERLHLAPPNAGEFLAKGSLKLDDSLRLSLRGRATGANLPAILDLAGLPDAWVRLRYTGDVSIDGKLAQSALTLKLSGKADQLMVASDSYRNSHADVLLHVPEFSVQAEASIDRYEITLNKVELARQQTRLGVLGLLSFDPEIGMDLQVTGDLNLADLGDIAHVPFAGRGAVAAVIEGPYANPTISATTTFKDFALFGYRTGDIQATLIYKALDLSIDRFVARRGHGNLSGQGVLSFADKPKLMMLAKVDAMAVSEVLATAGVSHEITSRIDARMTGSVDINGPLEALAGTVDVRSPKLVVEGASLGEAHFVGSFGEPDRLAFGELVAMSDAGSMLTRVTVHNDTTLSLDATLDAIELSAILPLLGGADLSGKATARAQLSGPGNELSGDIDVFVPNLVAYKTKLGASKIRGAVKQSTMALSGTLLNGAAQVQGDLFLSSKLPYALTAQLTDVKAEDMWPLGELSLRASGSMFSQGALADPTSILADIQLTQAHAELGKLKVDATRQVHLQYAQEILTVLDLAAVGNGVSFSAAGRSWSDGTVDASFVGTADLSALRSLWPSAQFARGKSDLRLRVTGTWDNPALDGEAVVQNGALRLSTGQTVEKLQGRLLFSGHSIEVLGVTGNVGGGTMRIGGNISLVKGDAELNLRAELGNVTLRPWPELVTTFNGQLALLGPSKDLLLRGQLNVGELRYSANVDLEKLIPRRQAPPLRVADAESEHPVRLAISVQAPGNVWLLSSVMEAEFQADLMVAGTSERIGLLGNLSAKRGRAEFQDVQYQIQRASVLFTEEYRIFTEFDVRATTTACGMDINVELHGNSDGYNATTTGDDATGPVPPQDVIACLYAGIRRDEGDASLQSNLGISSIDALWAVSGVDAQVRRLFPMVDELRLSSRWSSRSKRTTPRIVIGKELGEHLKATYSRALDEYDDQLVSVEYELNSVATMLGSWNSASEAQRGDFGLDLRLRWEFQ